MKQVFAALLLISVMISSGCAPVRAPAITATAEVALADTPVAPPTATAEPSATSLPGKVVLISGAESGQAEADFLTAAAAEAGFVFEPRSDLSAGLTEDVRVVVAMSQPANLTELSTASPNTQFIVFSGAELAPSSNVSVVRVRPEHQAFAAGFIAILLSPDWRSAGLLPADGPMGAGLQQAFINGGRFFCGVCAPGWPLGMTYPQVAALPLASDGPTWQSAAAGLFDTQKVEAYYLTPEAVKPEIITYLSGLEQFGRRVQVVGAQTPPEELRAQWAATIRFDTMQALEQVWSDVLAGSGGVSMDAPLVLEDVDDELLGEGRLRLVEEVLTDLRSGLIYPFDVPAE